MTSRLRGVMVVVKAKTPSLRWFTSAAKDYGCDVHLSAMGTTIAKAGAKYPLPSGVIIHCTRGFQQPCETDVRTQLFHSSPIPTDPTTINALQSVTEIAPPTKGAHNGEYSMPRFINFAAPTPKPQSPSTVALREGLIMRLTACTGKVRVSIQTRARPTNQP